jgi:hypothetical protein
MQYYAEQPSPHLSGAVIKDMWYASWEWDVLEECMCRYPPARGDRGAMAWHTSWSCLIKALARPGYMSQPGGSVWLSFQRRRKLIRWERGGAMPVGNTFVRRRATHLVNKTHPSTGSFTPTYTKPLSSICSSPTTPTLPDRLHQCLNQIASCHSVHSSPPLSQS